MYITDVDFGNTCPESYMRIDKIDGDIVVNLEIKVGDTMWKDTVKYRCVPGKECMSVAKGIESFVDQARIDWTKTWKRQTLRKKILEEAADYHQAALEWNEYELDEDREVVNAWFELHGNHHELVVMYEESADEDDDE